MKINPNLQSPTTQKVTKDSSDDLFELDIKVTTQFDSLVNGLTNYCGSDDDCTGCGCNTCCSSC